MSLITISLVSGNFTFTGIKLIRLNHYQQKNTPGEHGPTAELSKSRTRQGRGTGCPGKWLHQLPLELFKRRVYRALRDMV